MFGCLKVRFSKYARNKPLKRKSVHALDGALSRNCDESGITFVNRRASAFLIYFSFLDGLFFGFREERGIGASSLPALCRDAG